MKSRRHLSSKSASTTHQRQPLLLLRSRLFISTSRSLHSINQPHRRQRICSVRLTSSSHTRTSQQTDLCFLTQTPAIRTAQKRCACPGTVVGLCVPRTIGITGSTWRVRRTTDRCMNTLGSFSTSLTKGGKKECLR